MELKMIHGNLLLNSFHTSIQTGFSIERSTSWQFHSSNSLSNPTDRSDVKSVNPASNSSQCTSGSIANWCTILQKKNSIMHPMCMIIMMSGISIIKRRHTWGTPQKQPTVLFVHILLDNRLSLRAMCPPTSKKVTDHIITMTSIPP